MITQKSPSCNVCNTATHEIMVNCAQRPGFVYCTSAPVSLLLQSSLSFFLTSSSEAGLLWSRMCSVTSSPKARRRAFTAWASIWLRCSRRLSSWECLPRRWASCWESARARRPDSSFSLRAWISSSVFLFASRTWSKSCETQKHEN